jgi:hypothetical protein
MLTLPVRLFVYVLLLYLVLLDAILSTTALFFPETWFKVFHDAAYVDPQGLCRRTGAVWLSFTLLQIIALFRWEKAPWWLVLIAGVRLTELFSDWTYIYVSQSLTGFGFFGLFISPPGNLAIGCFLVWVYLKTPQGMYAAKNV